jgi:hypothetical protein
MERQQLMAFDFGKFKGCAAKLTHNRTIRHHSKQKLVASTSLLCPEYERQWSINHFRPCI